MDVYCTHVCFWFYTLFFFSQILLDSSRNKLWYTPLPCTLLRYTALETMQHMVAQGGAHGPEGTLCTAVVGLCMWVCEHRLLGLLAFWNMYFLLNITDNNCANFFYTFMPILRWLSKFTDLFQGCWLDNNGFVSLLAQVNE